jgi:hypothetical protein
MPRAEVRRVESPFHIAAGTSIAFISRWWETKEVSMRPKSSVLVIFGAFLVLSILSVPVSLSIDGLTSGPAWAQEQPPATPPADPPAPANPPASPNVQVEVSETDSDWIVDPFWLVVGGIGLLAILALLVAAGRSSTTEGPTVIKT